MKRLVSLGVSLLLLALIYWKVEARGLLQVLSACHPGWLMLSLGMLVPITLLTAWRLQQLMPTRPSRQAREDSQTTAPEACCPPPEAVTPLARPPDGGIQPPAALTGQSPYTVLGFGEANRLILVASVLNMVLPSKMGDIAKAYFMRQRGHLGGALSLALVVFEKACDMLSLLLWCAFGLVLYPQQDWLFAIMTPSVLLGLLLGGALLGSRTVAEWFFASAQALAPAVGFRTKLMALQASWREMHTYFWRDPRQVGWIAAMSIFLWFLHLLQIWLFILALNVWTPFVVNLALSPLAILAGLLPLTFAGIGTRDAALILFYQPFFPAHTGAALGVLCTSRYVLPALAGLPFLRQYLTTVKLLRRSRAPFPPAYDA